MTVSLSAEPAVGRGAWVLVAGSMSPHLASIPRDRVARRWWWHGGRGTDQLSSSAQSTRSTMIREQTTVVAARIADVIATPGARNRQPMAGDEQQHLVRFTLNGLRYELSRRQVDERLIGAVPNAIRTHAVCINRSWFPVRQAFGLAVGLPGSEFTSDTARRHLAGLGYEVTVGGRVAVPDRTAAEGRVQGSAIDIPSAEWHTEANVQATLVKALVVGGWSIVSVASTATKEHGIDVVATRGDEAVGVEVKGYPSRNYADPARATETKTTQPSTQAVHWYAQAILAAMRLKPKRPDLRSVIALPDFQRYRGLYRETAASLDASQIEVWWVREGGALSTAAPGA